MTAGKGILHSEMPASFDYPAYGFKLWINLEKKRKFCEPQYQEIEAAKMEYTGIANARRRDDAARRERIKQHEEEQMREASYADRQ